VEWLREHLRDCGILRGVLDPINDGEHPALAFNPQNLELVSCNRSLVREDEDVKLLGEVYGRAGLAGRSMLLPGIRPLLFGLHHNLSRINDSACSPSTEGEERQKRESKLATNKDASMQPQARLPVEA